MVMEMTGPCQIETHNLQTPHLSHFLWRFVAAVRLVHEAVYRFLCLLAVCDGVQFGSLWGVGCNVVSFLSGHLHVN